MDVIGGGIRGAWDGDRDEDGERYNGSSWSGACGSSKESRNLEGDMEPRTEFSNDILSGGSNGVKKQSYDGAGSIVECCPGELLRTHGT